MQGRVDARTQTHQADSRAPRTFVALVFLACPVPSTFMVVGSKRQMGKASEPVTVKSVPRDSLLNRSVHSEKKKIKMKRWLKFLGPLVFQRSKGKSNPAKGHFTATSVNIKTACSIKEAPVPEQGFSAS